MNVKISIIQQYIFITVIIFSENITSDIKKGHFGSFERTFSKSSNLLKTSHRLLCSLNSHSFLPENFLYCICEIMYFNKVKIIFNLHQNFFNSTFVITRFSTELSFMKKLNSFFFGHNYSHVYTH